MALERIAWEEPVAFKRAWEKQLHHSPLPRWAPGVVLGIAALFVGVTVAYHRPIAGGWPASLALGLGLGLLLGYGLPFLTSISPRIVTIYENGVGYNQVTGGGVRLVRWKWAQISHCSLQTMAMGGREYTVLGVHFIDNTWQAFALSGKVNPTSIGPYIAAHGKALRGTAPADQR